MSHATELTGDANASRVQAYLELTKLRISVMVLLTFVVAAILEFQLTGTPISWGSLVWGMLGMLLVAGSGNATNMYVERYTDFRMPRTAARPLPTYRLRSTEVALFSAITLGMGLAILFQWVNWPTALCGLLNWVLYALIYTPLKRRHWCNTEVGAIAGAMPIIMGALAATEQISLVNWAFFGVLFLWQFPHFMAIAWKYRDQYRSGGLRMLTVTEPTGRAAGQKAVVSAALLIVMSLVPAAFSKNWIGVTVLAIPALMLGGYYLAAAWQFFLQRNDQTARKLMLVSLFYLPMYMIALLAGTLIARQ
jgi:protoheme IX farnesyltransferase